jgi:hypothetical protein
MASVTFDINLELQLTTFIVHGDISLTEIEQAISTFYHKQATLNALWDLRKSSLQRLSTSDVQSLIEYLKSNTYVRDNGKTAMVAPKDADFGLVRMGEVYAENLPTSFRVFRSIEEAYDWIRQEQDI